MSNIGYNPFTGNFDFLGESSTTTSGSSVSGSITDLSYFILSEKAHFDYILPVQPLGSFLNRRLIEIRITIDDPFDGIGTNITIGNISDNDLYIKPSDTQPKMEDTYVVELDILIPEDTIILYINGDNISRGSGSLLIKYIIGG